MEGTSETNKKIKDKKNKPRKSIRFSIDTEEVNLKQTNPTDPIENPVSLELPINQHIIASANIQLDLFRNALRQIFYNHDENRQLTLAESIAYRFMASIDWTRYNIKESYAVIYPLLKTNSETLCSFLSQDYGILMHLKDSEVKKSIHEWSLWRTEANKEIWMLIKRNILEPKSSDDDNTLNNSADFQNLFQEKVSTAGKNLHDLVMMYVIAKWSSDKSRMRFGTFMHYGIPRARIRAVPTEYQSASEEKDVLKDFLSKQTSLSDVNNNYDASDDTELIASKLQYYPPRPDSARKHHKFLCF